MPGPTPAQQGGGLALQWKLDLPGDRPQVRSVLGLDGGGVQLVEGVPGQPEEEQEREEEVEAEKG